MHSMGAMPSNAAVDMSCKYIHLFVVGYPKLTIVILVVIFVVQDRGAIIAWANAIS